MFYFGSPEDTARVYLESALGSAGPGLEEKHYEEMEEEDLRSLYVYLRIAYYRALESGASDETVEVLVEWHDEVFLHLLDVLEGFRSLVCTRRYRPIRNERDYYKLAGCGSAN